jgi:hypothetical protein
MPLVLRPSKHPPLTRALYLYHKRSRSVRPSVTAAGAATPSSGECIQCWQAGPQEGWARPELSPAGLLLRYKMRSSRLVQSPGIWLLFRVQKGYEL